MSYVMIENNDFAVTQKPQQMHTYSGWLHLV